MDMQNKIQNTPKMDIKQHSLGEAVSIDYDGKIQIITQRMYKKLLGSVKRAKELEVKLLDKEESHKAEIEQLKKEHSEEVLNLKRVNNQLATNLDNLRSRYDELSNSLKKRTTEEERQVQRVQALANRQGQGRPKRLTESHKQWIYTNIGRLKEYGGKWTIKDFEKYLVMEMGYNGGYEPIRAFISALRSNQG